MNHEESLPRLIAFNQIMKEIDGLYHNYAKDCGLSDTAFWLLYSLWGGGRVKSQRELCAEWFYSPQTLNSALKVLEKRGYIRLVPSPKGGRNKQILYTDKGAELVERTVSPLIQAELGAFSDLGGERCQELLALSRAYTELLRVRIRQIENHSSED